jgi:hypothetical protein
MASAYAASARAGRLATNADILPAQLLASGDSVYSSKVRISGLGVGDKGWGLRAKGQGLRLAVGVSGP